ncbi:Hypothetical predicted protein [Marmota monax]|uniref:Uncharacterized protein n=1 Tax=Marmota monax TaxID=9995 RepID=A0A5E4C5H5_MARMO|nr:hypothetical protein GHT09_018032 [Marmota monax]VTJ77177.1 Hypothetical predicted protein [Marmota monax]
MVTLKLGSPRRDSKGRRDTIEGPRVTCPGRPPRPLLAPSSLSGLWTLFLVPRDSTWLPHLLWMLPHERAQGRGLPTTPGTSTHACRWGTAGQEIGYVCGGGRGRGSSFTACPTQGSHVAQSVPSHPDPERVQNPLPLRALGKDGILGW